MEGAYLATVCANNLLTASGVFTFCSFLFFKFTGFTVDYFSNIRAAPITVSAAPSRAPKAGLRLYTSHSSGNTSNGLTDDSHKVCVLFA